MLNEKPEIKVASEGIHTRYDQSRFHTPFATFHYYTYHGSLEWRGESIPLNPGDIIIMPPDQTTTYRFSEPENRHLYLHFSARGIREEVNGYYKAADQFQMEKRIWQVLSMSFSNRFSAEIKLWDLLLDLLEGNPAASDKAGQSPSSDTAYGALDFIHKNLRTKLSLEIISRYCGISRNHLNLLMKRKTGMTVQQYIIGARMRRARDLLLHTALPVKETAWECGIPDLQYFNKLIREAFGVSPRKLREEGDTEDHISL